MSVIQIDAVLESLPILVLLKYAQFLKKYEHFQQKFVISLVMQINVFFGIQPYVCLQAVFIRSLDICVPGDIIFAQLACPLNYVIFVYIR